MVLAKEAGLLYAAVAMATDYDCWRDTGDKVCVADVLKTFKENVEKITKLFVHIVPKIAAKDWSKEISELKVGNVEKITKLSVHIVPKMLHVHLRDSTYVVMPWFTIQLNL